MSSSLRPRKNREWEPDQPAQSPRTKTTVGRLHCDFLSRPVGHSSRCSSDWHCAVQRGCRYQPEAFGVPSVLASMRVSRCKPRSNHLCSNRSAAIPWCHSTSPGVSIGRCKCNGNRETPPACGMLSAAARPMTHGTPVPQSPPHWHSGSTLPSTRYDTPFNTAPVPRARTHDNAGSLCAISAQVNCPTEALTKVWSAVRSTLTGRSGTAHTTTRRCRWSCTRARACTCGTSTAAATLTSSAPTRQSTRVTTIPG